MEILSTKRLILRVCKKDDFEILHKIIFSDIDVYQFTFGSNGFTKEESFKFLMENANFNSLVGLSVLVEKESLSIIGLSGVIPCEVLGKKDFEIGFILQKSSWGKGYAKEIGAGQLDFIKNTLKQPRALALADPKNQNSIKTIKSLQLVHVKNTITKNGERSVFLKNF